MTPTPASNLSDEQIEEAIAAEVGYYSGAWDTVPIGELIAAFRKVLDRARATAEPVLLEELDARLESLAALKKRADTMPIMNEWQWLNSLRNRLKGRLGATVAPSPAPTIHTDFCWLVELRSPHITTPIYHTGFVTLSGESRSTKLPQEAKRYPTKEAAQRVAIKLGFTLAGTWEAIEHGFERAASGASPEPTAERALLEFWSHEGRLQTFEDRERFRKAVRSLAVGTEIPQKHSADPVASGGTPPGAVDGTFKCPRCGLDTPHWHDPRDPVRVIQRGPEGNLEEYVPRSEPGEPPPEDIAYWLAHGTPSSDACSACKGAGTQQGMCGSGPDTWACDVECSKCGGTGARPVQTGVS